MRVGCVVSRYNLPKWSLVVPGCWQTRPLSLPLRVGAAGSHETCRAPLGSDLRAEAIGAVSHHPAALGTEPGSVTWGAHAWVSHRRRSWAAELQPSQTRPRASAHSWSTRCDAPLRHATKSCASCTIAVEPASRLWGAITTDFDDTEDGPSVDQSDLATSAVPRRGLCRRSSRHLRGSGTYASSGVAQPVSSCTRVTPRPRRADLSTQDARLRADGGCRSARGLRMSTAAAHPA